MNDLASNIKARQEAEAFVELVGEQPQRFWETLRDLAIGRLPPAPVTVDRNPPMDDQEAIRFEASPVPYGKHSGESVGVVPCDYLLFLTEGDMFSQRLKRYVKSKRFQERQDET